MYTTRTAVITCLSFVPQVLGMCAFTIFLLSLRVTLFYFVLFILTLALIYLFDVLKYFIYLLVLSID